jgi:hypothetical protein
MVTLGEQQQIVAKRQVIVEEFLVPPGSKLAGNRKETQGITIY